MALDFSNALRHEQEQRFRDDLIRQLADLKEEIKQLAVKVDSIQKPASKTKVEKE